MNPEPLAVTAVAKRNENHSLLDEYQCVAQQTGSISDRRQTTNDIYVGINVVFLTGLALFLPSIHFTSWWGTAGSALIALVAVFVNGTWIRLLQNYRELIGVRINYLMEMEKQFPPKGADQVRGVYLAEQALYQKKGAFGFSMQELRLARFFQVIYPALAVVIGVLTYLVAQKYITPPTF